MPTTAAAPAGQAIEPGVPRDGRPTAPTLFGGNRPAPDPAAPAGTAIEPGVPRDGRPTAPTLFGGTRPAPTGDQPPPAGHTIEPGVPRDGRPVAPTLFGGNAPAARVPGAAPLSGGQPSGAPSSGGLPSGPPSSGAQASGAPYSGSLPSGGPGHDGTASGGVAHAAPSPHPAPSAHATPSPHAVGAAHGAHAAQASGLFPPASSTPAPAPAAAPSYGPAPEQGSAPLPHGTASSHGPATPSPGTAAPQGVALTQAPITPPPGAAMTQGPATPPYGAVSTHPGHPSSMPAPGDGPLAGSASATALLAPPAPVETYTGPATTAMLPGFIRPVADHEEVLTAALDDADPAPRSGLFAPPAARTAPPTEWLESPSAGSFPPAAAPAPSTGLFATPTVATPQAAPPAFTAETPGTGLFATPTVATPQAAPHSSASTTAAPSTGLFAAPAVATPQGAPPGPAFTTETPGTGSLPTTAAPTPQAAVPAPTTGLFAHAPAGPQTASAPFATPGAGLLAAPESPAVAEPVAGVGAGVHTGARSGLFPGQAPRHAAASSMPPDTVPHPAEPTTFPTGGRVVAQTYAPPERDLSYLRDAEERTLNRNAAWALAGSIIGIVAGIASLRFGSTFLVVRTLGMPIWSFTALIAGIIAIFQIRKNPWQRGMKHAVAGIVLTLLYLVAAMGYGVYKVGDAVRTELDRQNAAAAAGASAAPAQPSGNAAPAAGNGGFDLKQYDCVGAIPEGMVFSIEKIPCAQPHRAQVYATFTLPDGEYPGDVPVVRSVESRCAELAQKLTLAPGVDEETAEVAFLHPTQGSWRAGDRTGICLVGTPDTKTGPLFR